MWIYSRLDQEARRALARVALDACGLAVALAFLPELAGTRARAALDPHPGWIAVLVMAARYGTTGLFAGMIAAAGAAGLGSALAGHGPLGAWSRIHSGPGLIAFGACLAVAWVASSHLRRQTELLDRLRTLSNRAAGADAAIEALRGVVMRLRARADRTWTSLSFLRDVAGRLASTDPVAAAEGAADLALARTGACAAAVRVGTGEFQRLLAIRDARGPDALTPLVLRDADLTVPIRNGNDRVGVIALWGVPPTGVDEATARDLAVIASWFVPAISVAAWRPVGTEGRVRRVG